MRTCGICSEIYDGEFGECPKCDDAHKKAIKGFSWEGRQSQRGKPTLDIQEHNLEEL